MSDIKMSEAFDLPLHVDITGVIFDNDSCAIGEICGTIKQSEAVGHAINNHDNLSQQVKDLEFSLDDRDCYIADADMKNEALTKQVAELRAALSECRKYIECDTNNRLKPHNPSYLVKLSDKALEEKQ